jgi:hypothetical protein
MLTALNLGDMVFDPRGFVFIKSLHAIAVVGLMECEDAVGACAVARDVVQLHQAESFICLGDISSRGHVSALKDALPPSVRIHLVSSKIEPTVRTYAEEEHIEVHQELVWAKYRFADALVPGTLELYFVSAIGGAPTKGRGRASTASVIKFGRSGIGARALPVFLKGLGQVLLPSVNPKAKKVSALRKELARYDAFAAGHTRVFPMGRVAEIEPAATFGKVPLAVSTMKKKKGKSHGKAVVPTSS